MNKLVQLSCLVGVMAGCAFPKIVDVSDAQTAETAVDANTRDADASNTPDVPEASVRMDASDVTEASAPTDASDASDASDVQDTRPDVCVPSGAEVCDGLDNNCDGMTDNVPAASLQNNDLHCGACGNSCGALSCASGVCTPFASTGAEGAFNPPAGMVTTLSPGIHHFTTITIPATATVRVGLVAGTNFGSGILDLRATGAVVIDGTLDLAGANGANSLDQDASRTTCNNDMQRGGAHGGAAGLGRATLAGTANSCNAANVARGNAVDSDGAGSAGSMTPGRAASCGGPGGNNGGGNSGGRRGSGGGGGGGAAGGGGGAAFYNETAPDRTTAAGGNGGRRLGTPTPSLGGVGSCTSTVCTAGGGSGGEPALGATPGQSGTITLNGMPFQAAAGGGGGGSIGRAAFMDLALNTLSPGSSGGGGGGGGDPCPAYGHSYGLGGGGGGGGGALRIASTVSIRITATAVLRVNGGDGGQAAPSFASGGGGGGSGGAIDLRAPALTVQAGASVSAARGTGGSNVHPNGGRGGNGGLGRIRLGFNSSGACTISGTAFSHTFATPGTPCAVAPTSTLGTVYGPVTKFVLGNGNQFKG
ncbi:MAG: putative metal-binding motif-containing protein [Deltaproteobacteria bacterium]|nr:putative metal-binding motif-containing protein [Deltaproteobacteria bacterium]